MLAELAAANAAFAVIKQTVQNGKELSSAAHAIGEYIGIKEKLEKDGHKKKNSFWASFKGSGANDLDEFMALEKIHEQEHELILPPISSNCSAISSMVVPLKGLPLPLAPINTPAFPKIHSVN